jgi:hypothetical protein
MSLQTTISQYAASNPTVAAAVNTQATESAMLSGLLTGDSADTGLLGALYSQATESATLLNSINPVNGQPLSAPAAPSKGVGGHVDITA